MAPPRVESPVLRIRGRRPRRVDPPTSSPLPPRGGVSPSFPLPLGEGQGEGVLAVSERERALVGPELRAFVAGLRDQATRRAYGAVLESIEAGAVEGESLDRLGAFLELALTTGRARHRLGPHGEDALRRLYERTARGAAARASAAAVGEALAPLVGGTLRGLSVDVVRPGTYRFVLETDQYRVQLGFAPAGVTVDNVELSL